MSGTKAGGAKAAATNKAKYGPDYYKNIGAEGGRNGHTGGFYANRELARVAGSIGGKISKRSSGKPKDHAAQRAQEVALYSFVPDATVRKKKGLFSLFR